jgi:methionyl aminopeptidase
MDTNKISSMRTGGKILAGIRRELIASLKPGLDLFDIELLAQKLIRGAGAIPNFAFVDNYGFATCLAVNDQAVHSRPRHYYLNKGDLVTLDVGLEWRGWQLDTSDSRLVGLPDDRFLTTGRHALKKAITMVTPGRRIGQISRSMQQIVEAAGYSPVRQFCGHAIGRKIHEDPQIPCFLDRPVAKTSLIEAGMTLAIEVMMTGGSWELKFDPDGWSSRTADGSRFLQLEHTVLVTSSKPEILTK